jgi:hypothetical protein
VASAVLPGTGRAAAVTNSASAPVMTCTFAEKGGPWGIRTSRHRPSAPARAHSWRTLRAALDVGFTAAQLARLDTASAIGLGFPHDMLAGARIRRVTAGDPKIEYRR